jgi:hypothetical protein
LCIEAAAGDIIARPGPFVNKSKSSEYRANAADCTKLAALANESTTKLAFLNMAEAWLRLADHAELSKRYHADDDVGSSKSPDQDTTCEGDGDHDREA